MNDIFERVILEIEGVKFVGARIARAYEFARAYELYG